MNATAAYRTDVAGSRGPFSDWDGQCIAVAALLEQAVAVEDERPRFWRGAVDAAARVLERAGQRRDARDFGDEAATVLLRLATFLEDAGALNLSAYMLDLLSDPSLVPDVLSRGRALAHRARVAWKLGNLEEASGRYAYVDTLGRQDGSDELRARAALGRAALAQMRGNYPEMQREARRAVRLARRVGAEEVERTATFAAIRSAAISNDFEAAVRGAWDLYRRATNEERAGEALQTIGQLLLERGQIDGARSAFATVASMRLPARVLLPAVGGLAIASAYAGAEPTVEWTVREITRLPPSGAPPYALCSALVECASALQMLGRVAEARECALRALTVAERHGFHELGYRAEHFLAVEVATAIAAPVQPVQPVQPVGAVATRVMYQLEAMRPERLPEHLTLATAGA